VITEGDAPSLARLIRQGLRSGPSTLSLRTPFRLIMRPRTPLVIDAEGITLNRPGLLLMDMAAAARIPNGVEGRFVRRGWMPEDPTR